MNFLIIPEYKYIPYRDQTFLEKKDLRSWENKAKGQVWKLGCGCGGGMVGEIMGKLVWI